MNTFNNTTLIVLISMLLAALMSENTIVTATLTTASSNSIQKTETEASLEDEVNEIDLLDFLDEERLLMSSDDMNMTGSHDGNSTDDEMDWGTPSSAPIRVGVSGVVVVVAALAAATGMFL